MKKNLIIALVLAFLATSGFSFAGQADAASSITGGTLIKGKNNPTIYYVGEDGKRYVFPNANTFFSWYEDFSGIVTVNDTDLYSYQLGGNVTYKPGALLIKIQTDPKVYAVSNNGILRWIKTEALARELYGDKWSKLIDDVPDSFFTNYTVGEAITDSEAYDPNTIGQEYPTFSHYKGFRTKVAIQNKITNRIEKRCQHLQDSVNQLQKRLARWGMEISGVGDDFVEECVDNNLPSWVKNDKVEICHITSDEAVGSVTINVSRAALRAHLAHGDSIGACSGSDDETDDTDNTDITAPIISNLGSDVKGTSAIISWNTNEAATSTVKHATSSLDIASSIIEVNGPSTATTSHAVTLSGLATSTTYFYKVYVYDAVGNLRVSEQRSFTTLASDPDITAPVISNLNVTVAATSTVITWETNEAATGKVHYATDHLNTASDVLVLQDASYTTSHSFTLTGLATSTLYYYKVESSDSSSNKGDISESTFTTLAE